MTLRITSWNINSVRIRLDLIKRFVDQVRPDVLCLQEIKTENQFFPGDALRDMGYDFQYFSGQKSYHGVAILSKIPLKHARCDQFIDKDEKRHICAEFADGTVLHNFYVPAGGDVPDPAANPKFKDKLDFVNTMGKWSAGEIASTDKVIILGDMNIAPLEHDVWSHKQLLNVVSHTPVEVEAFARLKAASGWVDCAREFVPEHEKLYSWWSYRATDWAASNRGRRLDHIWITPALKPALKACDILRDARGWENPSDHVPVTVTLEGIA